MNKGMHKIQKTTVIEILNEKEYNEDPKNACVSVFRNKGQIIKIHYRELFPNRHNEENTKF